MPDLPAYTWSTSERQYRDRWGRFVSRAEVRGALDAYLDSVTGEIPQWTQSMIEGGMSIGEWQSRMEAAIKRSHTAATAIGAGGWKQVTQLEWLDTGRRIKDQYRYLRRFANELETGVNVRSNIVSSAEMYGLAATGTYEAVLRKGDLAKGFDRERRLLHSENPCESCIAYANEGWQPAGKLPGIGEQCQCKSRCRCTFDRQRSKRKELMTFAEFIRLLDGSE